jgi:hypothetical protein
MSSPPCISISRLTIALAVVLGMLLGAERIVPRDVQHSGHTHDCVAGDTDCGRADADSETGDERPSRTTHDHAHAPDHGHDGASGFWVTIASIAYASLRPPGTGATLNKRNASGRLDRPPRMIFAV